MIDRVHASLQATSLASAHHIPVTPAARLIGDLARVNVFAGLVAGVRLKAAGKLEPFMDRVRTPLRQARMLYADSTCGSHWRVISQEHRPCTLAGRDSRHQAQTTG